MDSMEHPSSTGEFGGEAWMARLDERLNQLETKVDRINSKLDNKVVTQEEFKPVKLLVYGGTAAVLMGFVGAVITMVVKAS